MILLGRDNLVVPNMLGKREQLGCYTPSVMEKQLHNSAGCMAMGMGNGFQPGDCWALPSYEPGHSNRSFTSLRGEGFAAFDLQAQAQMEAAKSRVPL